MPVETPENSNLLEEPEIGAHYRHYKGNVYTPLSLCTIEASETPAVAYASDDPGDERVWIRLLTEWNEPAVDAAGNRIKRFTLIEEPKGPKGPGKTEFHIASSEETEELLSSLLRVPLETLANARRRHERRSIETRKRIMDATDLIMGFAMGQTMSQEDFDRFLIALREVRRHS